MSAEATTDRAGTTRDRVAKHARITALLDARGAEAIELASPASLAWYLDGARTHVSLAGPPIARLVVHRDGAELGVFANEAGRLAGEELGGGELEGVELAGGFPLSLHRIPWHGSLDPAAWWPGFEASTTGRHVTGPDRAGRRLIAEEDAAVELRAARAVLLPGELARYRALCRDAAEVLTDVLSGVGPDTTERAVAARLGAGLIERGADPVVLLVAGTERLAHRHPLPTDGPLGRRAMAVVCARRAGLIANVTRWVAFGPTVAREEEADEAILRVEADVFAALAPGVPLASLLDVLRAAYPRHGFADDEWTRHHQGGAAGYNGRDPRLAPGVADVVAAGQAFAWNPSAPGAKVEDTVLLGTDGIEALSVDPRWPVVDVEGLARPAVLRNP
ncbi:M24 family metallopeptidase [Zafaria sp. Z1313]|uniref:M24 family metallopeptidase n=1 Tax=Zafaria sp. Z1313 TaxID=3423202 RepID=UPI003D301D13